MAPKMSKRPAAAMSSSPDANEDGCKRDKGKGEKWAKMADKKQIPDHLLALYNEVPAGTSKRKHQTTVINAVFKRRSDGGFDLNTTDPISQQSLESYDKRYSKEQDKGLTKTLFLWKYFQGNQAAMDRAYENGEIFETKDAEGRKFWCHKEMVIGREVGRNETNSIQQQKKARNDQAEAIADIMRKMNWGWDRCKDDPISNGVMSKDAVKMLNAALQSQNRLATDALKLIKNHSEPLGENRVKELTSGHAKAQSAGLSIEHLLKFKLLPSQQEVSRAGLDNFIREITEQTQAQTELIEVSKGLVRAASKTKK